MRGSLVCPCCGHKLALAIQATPEIVKRKKYTMPTQGTLILLNRLLNLTSEYFLVSENLMKGESKEGETVNARQYFCWYANKIKRIPSPQIAHYLGYADHTTVVYSCKKIKGYIDTNQDVEMREGFIEFVESNLKALKAA